MKKTDYLIILNTETAEGKDLTKGDIITRHTNPTHSGGFGWRRPGIDYLVTLDGSLETIIPEESPGEVDLWGVRQGQKPINGSVKYLAYTGGKTPKLTKDKDTRTERQKDTLATVVKFYVKKFPDIQVLGFNQVPAKRGWVNPSFDVAGWLTAIGVPEKNIFKSV